MNKKLILGAVAVAAIVPVASAAKQKKAKSSKRPNILYIITDQQRWDALGCAGEFPFLKTPNLDKLASESAYFTNAYTPCAVSGPARAALLTGLLVEHTNVLTNELTAQDPVANNFTTQPTLDQILTQEGYYTEYHGKWHAPISWTDCYEELLVHYNKSNPFAYKLDHYTRYFAMLQEKFGLKNMQEGELTDRSFFNVPYAPDPIDRRAIHGYDENQQLVEKELNRRIMTQPDNHGLLRIPDEYSLTAYQATETIKALERASAQDKPFAVTLSIHFPHAPMLPTEGYYRMYNPDGMPTPASIADPLIDSPYTHQNGREALPEYCDPAMVKYMMSNYFGLITEIDHWLGEVFAALEKTGEADNTIVVFVSDHGEMLGSHGMREKNIFYEESARVPLMIRFPKKIKSIEVNNNVTTLDIAATLADYTSVEFADRDSRSLRSLIEGKYSGKNMTVTEWLYNGINQPSHMIVKDGWKLFFNYSKDSRVVPVLYNLNEDPIEMINLLGKSCAKRADYIDIAESLKQDMIEWLSDRNSGYVDQISQVRF
ncbi:MAG: sulfatase-like hydrolase/transferase [Rikenellaceae bacterium]